VAPGTGQSSPFASAPIGHRSRHPKVTTLEARSIDSRETSRGVRPVSVIPTSFRSWLTFGLTAVAGFTPALSARHPGGAFELNSSSESTLRKVFSTHTKRMVFVMLRIHGSSKNSARYALLPYPETVQHLHFFPRQTVVLWQAHPSQEHSRFPKS